MADKSNDRSSHPPGLPQHPKGWDRNPSSLHERAVVAGFLIATLTLEASSKQIYFTSMVALAALLTVAGSGKRWKAAPWLVFINGALLGGFVLFGAGRELTLFAVANTWPASRLLAVVTSLAAIGASMDEVLASLQYVRDQARLGRSVWRAFWGLSPKARRRGRAIKTM